MLKNLNKNGFLIFFLIIAIPSFFFIIDIIVDNSSYDIHYKREMPISMTDNEWKKDGDGLNLQSPLSNGLKKWTIIYYGAHDNNLAPDYPDIGSTDDVDVFAIEDGISYGDSRAFQVFSGPNDYIPLSNINPSWTDEVNMGHPDTLYYILKYCIDNYPSEHYWVVLDNHGGAYNGVCTDEMSGGDILSIGDLKTAFTGITSYLGRKFDGIYFHACLMSNLEIAVQLSPYVGYIVGFEPSVYQEYNLKNDVVVNILVTNPSLSPREFAIELVNQAYIPEMGDTLIAAVKLSKIQDLIDDIDIFATQLINIFNIYGKEIIDAREASESWYNTPNRLVDFIDFLEELYERVPNQMIRYYALEIMRGLGPSDQDYAILKHRKGSFSTYFMHGLSVYFPFDLSTYSSHYELDNDFCALTHWEEFLQVFYANDVTGALTPFGNSYVFFIILGAVPLIIIGGRNAIFKKR